MYPVKPNIAQGAHIGSREKYDELYRRSIESPDDFWREQSERISWSEKPETISRADFDKHEFSWFDGGKLNACYNCVDRHLEERGDKTAILWAKDEAGEYQHISYRELHGQVSRFANVLKAHGVKRGDRVAIYVGMMPELTAAMLACARIGAVHSVVFGGFSAEALRDRCVDAGSRVVITANEGLRGGRPIPLKATVDAALEGLDFIDAVIVARRTDTEVPMVEGRDFWLADEMAKVDADCPVEEVDAESPLFVLYTSGSTGKPKGVLHTTGGYMVYASLTHEMVFDLHEDDIYACVADCGWITGHTYIVYGPLANGATTVMFESTPNYPDAGRYWQMVDDLDITILYTAPTAIRAIAREGDDWVTKYSRKSLRILGTVGEPINPEVWKWYHDLVGGERCAIVDTWWQTETGGIMITPLPGAMGLKPGCATLPFFGVEPLLVDEEGNEREGNEVQGNLCIRKPWPGMARTIYGDHERYVETYFSKYPGLYFTGDGCRRDEDGYYWITGRVDDVLNVSGHRMGTAEVESALVAHPGVAEAAVVGYPHDIKGTGISAYVLMKPEYASRDRDEVIAELRKQVRTVIGPIATPDQIQISSGLPKTRSGKIMRRILRQISSGEYKDLGDVSTLAEPAVVEELVSEHQRGHG